MDCLRQITTVESTSPSTGRIRSDSMSHHTRPRPGRRRTPRRISKHSPLSTLQFYTTLMVLLLWCCTVTFAQGPDALHGNILESTLEKLARRGEILIDRSPPPDMSHLQRRQNGGGSPFGASSKGSTVTPAQPSSSNKAKPMELNSNTPGSTPESTASSTPTSSSASSSTSQAVDPSATNLPTAFDTSLGNNFTAPSCPAFFESFLANKQFQECLPFSQLLQVSHMDDHRFPGLMFPLELEFLLPSREISVSNNANPRCYLCSQLQLLLVSDGVVGKTASVRW
jgi:hypothetical protein